MHSFKVKIISIDSTDIFELNYDQILKGHSNQSFNDTALKIFRYQYNNVEVYQEFVDQLRVKVDHVSDFRQIPFLPVEFFKSKVVKTQKDSAEIIFKSSGTQNQTRSHHHVLDLELYFKSFSQGFEHFYGKANEYCILALLPSYLEREGSSLVYMVEKLIENSGHSSSGFYLNNIDELEQTLNLLKEKKEKTILIGVTFALLDFAENFQVDFPHLILMETGGMKGRRKEILRAEVHLKLKKAFGIDQVHSEYGMTELLSQGYSYGKGIFKSPPWMKVLTRDVNDPLSILNNSKTGGVNVIDFANLHSCSFIATQDLGKALTEDTFQIIGRFDDSDVRGCNLLVL